MKSPATSCSTQQRNEAREAEQLLLRSRMDHIGQKLLRIPIDPEIVSAGDEGRPIGSSSPQSAGATAFARVTEAIVAARPLQAAEGDV